MKSSNSRLKTITIILAILTIATYSNYAISQGVVTLPTAKKQTTTKKTKTTVSDYGKLAEQSYNRSNYTNAIKYGELGAKQNNAQAITVLGECYWGGLGVSKDYEKAASYYRTAAEQNYWYAQHLLGVCYQYGHGVTKNYSTACQWYAKVIENPETTEEYINLAKELYQKCSYAALYKSGNNNISDNDDSYGELAVQTYCAELYVGAVRYGTLGAARNDARAMTILGYCYLNGSAIQRSNEYAVSYFMKAAEQDFYMAQYQLGLCYLYEIGVPKNYATARQWLAKAIENPKSADWVIYKAKKHYKACNNGVAYKAGGE